MAYTNVRHMPDAGYYNVMRNMITMLFHLLYVETGKNKQVIIPK